MTGQLMPVPYRIHRDAGGNGYNNKAVGAAFKHRRYTGEHLADYLRLYGEHYILALAGDAVVIAEITSELTRETLRRFTRHV